MKDFLILRMLRDRKQKGECVLTFSEIREAVKSKTSEQYDFELWTLCKETSMNVIYNPETGTYTFTAVKYCCRDNYFRAIRSIPDPNVPKDHIPYGN